jgi:regulator of cell morphogenesis and NO signaling
VLYGKVERIRMDEEEEVMSATPEKKETGSAVRPEQTVGELVARHPQLRERLERLGIDYCCGGKKPLADAARENGLSLEQVVAELERALAESPAAAAGTDWTSATITALADHILGTHHAFTRSQLARVSQLLAKVQNAHRARHGAMLDDLRQRFDALAAELDSHLTKEEQILFPAIKGIDAFMAGQSARPVVHCGSVANPIRQMEREHEGAGGLLAGMRALTGGYRLPDDACQTFGALYEALEGLESDLHQHIHLENNVLFPRSVAQEGEMLRSLAWAGGKEPMKL